ncbi:MAG TPA: PDZ domain-containing protein [Gemmataceae bacterium]|nr:PDZ domain-containing protein [Gemmataceae bacterium]
MKYLLAAGLGVLLVLPTRADEQKDPPPKTPPTYEIPYRLTNTKHVMVRVKLNSKGPFNFIIDTGAPALIMTEEVAKKAGGKEKDGWTSFDRVELEGGLSIPKPRGIAIDMFQLKGMNSMGLAGVELHGVIGYNVLSGYRIEYDFTEPKLKWTPVDFDAPAPKRIVDKGGSQGGLELIGELMKFLAAFSGIKPNYDVHPRGFLGAELKAESKVLVVKSVIAGGPADKAGLKAGDRIQTAHGKSVGSPEDMLEAVKKLPEGTSVKLTLKRGDDSKTITVELGKGL